MHYLKVHFYCEQCDQKFDDKKAILDHQEKVHDKFFQCELCQKCFFDGGNLNSHKVTSHAKKSNEEKKKYYCDLCEFVTKERRSLVDHNLAIHLKTKDFMCDQCDFATSTKDGLRKHKKKKHQKSTLVNCELCDYTFKSSSPADVLSHMKTHQSNKPMKKCEHCSKEFLSKSGLNSHLKLIHRDKRYKCDICHVESKSVTFHKIHMRSHLPVEEQFKCDKCDTFVTNNQYKLTNHIKTNHSDLKNVHLECTVCRKEFTSHADHRTHMRENHKGKGVRIACTFCSEDFSDIWTWKMHLLRSHYQCHKCNEKFDTEESILSHMKDEHNDEYKCNQCSKQYFERKHLIRHVKTIHENIRAKKRYPCQSCEYVASIPSQLKYHMEHKHIKSVMYSCDICNYKSSWKRDFTRHMTFVHDKGNLPLQTCDICEFSTVNPNVLKQHMAVHYEKQFQCEVCKTEFTTSAALRQHMETFHNGELMKCDLCGFETRQKSAFDRHWSVHEKLAIKTCEVCEFSTTDKYFYERHMQKHSDFPPSFKCDYCDKVLTTKEGIRAHMKSVHQGKNLESKAKCHLCEKELSPKLVSLHLARIHSYCKQCDQKFQTTNDILDHMKDFHELDFQCNICFTRHFCIETLRTHINNSHNSQSEMFKCDICEHVTNSKRGLEKHLSSQHYETRMFQCDLCDWKTAYEMTLRKHMERMHSTREEIFQCDIAKCNYSSTEIQHLKAHKKSLKHQENLRKMQLTNQNGQWVVQLKLLRL